MPPCLVRRQRDNFLHCHLSLPEQHHAPHRLYRCHLSLPERHHAPQRLYQ
uniref:Uncharacterized protein n=1 Tax=Arundo donax TaxID=35708 RepID=A0A0A9CFW6_ARUDO